jgi:hypothetical protein
MNNCEGHNAPHPHTEDIGFYALFDNEGTKCTTGYLCSACLKDDIARGWDWRPTEPPEKT